MTDSPDRGGRSLASRRIEWSTLWRSALLAAGIVLAVSTQLLFEFDLYENWSLTDILLGWADYLLDQLLVGACIFFAVALVGLIPTRTGAGRRLLVVLAIVFGALTAEAPLLFRGPPAPEISTSALLVAHVARWLVVSGLAYLIFTFQSDANTAAAKVQEADLQRIQLDRQMTEAQLQSLLAQIEPHFLFNTLANVRQLYQTEPDRGRTMLGNFVEYLRAALPQMRQNETTLRQEADLARAYLDVLQVRMGKRLAVRFDIPPALAGRAFPSLALSTLTENAIKHGLNPLPEGGSIEIVAREEHGQLKVSVADTGVGLRQASGSGAGLANLRARLAALHGNLASLAFEANVPRGIRVTIVVPGAAAGEGTGYAT